MNHQTNNKFRLLFLQEKKPADEPTSTKLTPIIVTEKKIISLKKKSETSPPVAPVQRPTPSLTKPEAVKKTGDSQSVAPSSISAKPSSRPVLRLHTANQRLSDLEDYDEDELLADSPTPPNPTPSTNVAGTMFTNRRVVLTSSSATGDTAVKPKVLQTKNVAAKGIFDRLDAKIGVTEAAKRKIQKIVIKSND